MIYYLSLSNCYSLRLLVKCVSNLLMVIVTFPLYKLIKFLLQFFYYSFLFLLSFFLFISQKWGATPEWSLSPLLL